MSDPTNSPPYRELERVLGSFVNKDTKAEAVKANCIKDAEAAAVKAREQHEEAMMIQQNTASDSTTTTPSTPTPSTTITQTQTSPESTEAKDEEDDPLVTPIPQTYDEAINQLSRLRAMRDALLEEKSRNDKFVSRYQEKVAKAERMATLHNLIPRQLFVREDRYNDELEKVYKWSGISDQEIADLYRRKLGDTNNTKFKHHGASVINKDPYQNFRDVPDFSKVVNGKSLSSSSTTNSVLRDLKFMKKIAGDNIDV